MIILDENIERYWIELLRRNEYSLISVAEDCPGIPDQQVIRIAQESNGLLITEDKDFGELVFAHGFKNLSVIFLRYDQPEYNQIEDALLKCVSKYMDSSVKKYITITKSKIRVRGL